MSAFQTGILTSGAVLPTYSRFVERHNNKQIKVSLRPRPTFSAFSGIKLNSFQKTFDTERRRCRRTTRVTAIIEKDGDKSNSVEPEVEVEIVQDTQDSTTPGDIYNMSAENEEPDAVMNQGVVSNVVSTDGALTVESESDPKEDSSETTIFASIYASSENSPATEQEECAGEECEEFLEAKQQIASPIEGEVVSFIEESILIDEAKAQEPLSWPGQKAQEAKPEPSLPPVVKEVNDMFQEVFREDRVEMYQELAMRASEFTQSKMQQARESVEEASEDAFHASVEALVARITGNRHCTIQRIVVYQAGGVLLTDVDLGTMRVRKILLRVSSLPVLAAAVQGWKSESRKGPPLRIDKLHMQGTYCSQVNARMLGGSFQSFRGFPSGGISIHKMILTDTKLALAPTGWEDSPAPELASVHPLPLPVVELQRLVLTDIWNQMDPVTMVARLTDLLEPEFIRPKDAGMGSSGLRQEMGKRVKDGNIDVKVEEENISAWRGEWRREQAKGLYEGVTSMVGSIPLQPPQMFQERLPQGARIPTYDQVERLGGAVLQMGPSMVQAALQEKGFGPDVKTLFKLTQQGVPMRMLEDQGDQLLRMIETGVATAVLERGDLVRSLVERGLLEPLIAEGVLEVALQRPEMVVDLAGQGCLDGLVESGVLEAMYGAKNLHILKKLLKGNLIAGLTYSGILADIVGDR